jgi:hypothetical protein
VRFLLRGHGAFTFQGLDVSIADMAFHPVPVEVLRNLLLSLGFAIQLFLLGLSIDSFLFHHLLCGLSRLFLLCFICDVL